MKVVVFSLLIIIFVSILGAVLAEADQKEKQTVWESIVKYLKPPKPKARFEIRRWKPFATTVYLGLLKNCGKIVYPAKPRYTIKLPPRVLYRVAITPYWGTMTALPSRP